MARHGEQFGHGRALAGRVGAGCDCEYAGARCEQAGQVFGVQLALRVGQQDAQYRATFARGALPGQQVGMVFQAADNDFVARLQGLAAARLSRQTMRYEVE